MIALSVAGIALVPRVGLDGTAATLLVSAIWLSSLSGMVVACVSVAVIAVLNSRRGKR
jgi:hypothetical protein